MTAEHQSRHGLIIVPSVLMAGFAILSMSVDRRSFYTDGTLIEALNGNASYLIPVFVSMALANMFALNAVKLHRHRVCALITAFVFSMCEIAGFYADNYSSWLTHKANLGVWGHKTLWFDLLLLVGYISIFFPALLVFVTIISKKS